MADGKGGNLLDIIAPQTMMSLEALKKLRRDNMQEADKQSAIKSFINTIGQEPKALGAPVGSMALPATEFNAAVPGRFPEAPQSSTSALPGTQFNNMVGGRYNANDLPDILKQFAMTRAGLLGRAFPEEIAKSMLPKPPKIGFAPAGSQPIDENTGLPIGSRIPEKPPEGFNYDGTILPGYLDFLKKKSEATRDPLEQKKILAEINKIQKETENIGATEWEPMTESEKQARGLDINTPFKINRKTGNYELVSTGTRFNNDQNKAAGYANTMAEAEGALGAITEDGPNGTKVPYRPNQAISSLENRYIVGPAIRTFASKEYKTYKQKAMDWTLALLRFESGANVPDSEAEKYWTTYFPQPGDGDQVIKAKAASRAEKLKGVIAASGGAFDNLRKNAPTTQDQTQKSQVKPKDAPADAKQAPDGNWYSPDPLRPGKYVKW